MTSELGNREFYDADAVTYDEQRWTTRAGAFVNAAQQRVVSELCADWGGRSVLEAGPGTGRFSATLARIGARLTLLDLSSEMLEVSRKRLATEGLESSIDGIVEGSIYEMPFDDASFDCALSLNVFNHLEHVDKALAELTRVVRPGGMVLFNYANVNSYYWPVARVIDKRSRAIGQDVYSVWERPSRIRALIGRTGLELVRSLGHVHVPRQLQHAPVLPIVRVLDALSRSGPLRSLAAVHFCLCRKTETVADQREPKSHAP